MPVHPPPHSHKGSQQTSDFDANSLLRFQVYQNYHKQAVGHATEILSCSAEGIPDGLGISLKSWRRNPWKGSIFVAGMITLPVVGFMFVTSALTGMFIPHKLAASEPTSARAGNAVGRTINYTFNASRPGIAAAYAQHLQEKQARLGGYPANVGGQQPAGNLPVLTTGNTRLVNAGSSASAVPNAQGLDPATVQAIQNFAAGQ